MVRGKDACWEHCSLVDATRQKVRCNYCRREFSGGVYRMKFHLAQMKNKDIVPCTQVPNDVREKVVGMLSLSKKNKTPNKPTKIDIANSQQNSSSASGGAQQIARSGGQDDSTGPSQLVLRISPGVHPPADDGQKQQHDDADKKIAAFFFHNLISLNAAKSMYYQEMIDAVIKCGAGYKAPSYDKLRTSLLKRVKEDINDWRKKYQDAWREKGCTILCESLFNQGGNLFLVFSVASPKGILFLKSVDASARADDAHFLFELLDSIILEVGVDKVVQVITNGDTSFIYAGRLLMAKYPSLFWTPCASYRVNKMLEEISKLELVGMVLEESKKIIRYIYNDSSVHSTMRKFTGGMELIRPRITRFATHFLSLRAIVIQEDNLKVMFSHSEWLSYVHSRCPEARAVKSLLCSERFWVAAHEAVSISEPLLKLLRMVEGDMPAMGYIYEGIDRAKIAIKAYYRSMEDKYLAIWNIIDGIWNFQLHSSLHAAAAFLNPSIYFSTNFKVDQRMRNGFQEIMMKMAVEESDKIEITKEHPVYINAQGALGTEFSIMGRTLNTPGDWWTAYGYEIPTLQRVAIRILSQPCSVHWCRFNESTFESLHTKKYNITEFSKLSDLVFVHCNLWLQAIGHSRGGKSNPVIYDEIDVSSEWPTESEASSPLLDDSWLDNLPLYCQASH